MCGIAAYAFNNTPEENSSEFNEVLFRLLCQAQDSRGRDNCGLAIPIKNEDGIEKMNLFWGYDEGAHDSSTFFRFFKERWKEFPRFKNPSRILAHSRKASVGNKTIDGAHPYVIEAPENNPEKGRLIGVHNGTLYNHEELCKEYDIDASQFTTDSEALFYLMHHFGAEEILKKFVGAASLVWTYDNTTDIFTFASGTKSSTYAKTITQQRPLHFVQTNDGMYISSESYPLTNIILNNYRKSDLITEEPYSFAVNMIHTIRNARMVKSVEVERNLTQYTKYSYEQGKRKTLSSSYQGKGTQNGTQSTKSSGESQKKSSIACQSKEEKRSIIPYCTKGKTSSGDSVKFDFKESISNRTISIKEISALNRKKLAHSTNNSKLWKSLEDKPWASEINGYDDLKNKVYLDKGLFCLNGNPISTPVSNTPLFKEGLSELEKFLFSKYGFCPIYNFRLFNDEVFTSKVKAAVKLEKEDITSYTSSQNIVTNNQFNLSTTVYFFHGVMVKNVHSLLDLYSKFADGELMYSDIVEASLCPVPLHAASTLLNSKLTANDSIKFFYSKGQPSDSVTDIYLEKHGLFSFPFVNMVYYFNSNMELEQIITDRDYITNLFKEPKLNAFCRTCERNIPGNIEVDCITCDSGIFSKINGARVYNVSNQLGLDLKDGDSCNKCGILKKEEGKELCSECLSICTCHPLDLVTPSTTVSNGKVSC